MFNSECQIEGNGYTEYTDLNGYPRKSLKNPFQSAASVYSVYLFHPVSIQKKISLFSEADF